VFQIKSLHFKPNRRNGLNLIQIPIAIGICPLLVFRPTNKEHLRDMV